MKKAALRSVRSFIAFTTAVVLAAGVFGDRPFAQQQAIRSAGPNFDIRADTALAPAGYLARVAAQPATAAALASARADGMARLEAEYGALDTVTSPLLGTLEVVGAKAGSRFLTGPGDDRVGALRGFLASHADAYGLSQGQLQGLELVADYVNPAGNMAWVEFEQRINGIPVFQGLVRGGFTARGELARVTGPMASGIDAGALPTSSPLAAAQAVSLAAAHVGWNVEASSLVQKSADAAGRVTFDRGSMDGDAKAWLVYFPLAPGVARLAWVAEIWGDPDAFIVALDASDGTVLFRKNITNYQTQSASYTIYNDDSPAPMSPSTMLPGSGTQAPFIARTTISLIGNEVPNTFNNLGWITDGMNVTDGNNVEAGIDIAGANGVDAPVTGVPNRTFNFGYNPQTDDPATAAYRNGEVTDMFYWTNRYHDSLYLLGFTEAARNFQNDNFGRGGAQLDRVSAEAQNQVSSPPCNPLPCANNANFSTPTDGGRGRMQMFIFPGPTPDRSSGIEHDVLLHELTHGTSNRLHNNALGLITTMSAGMGEGWSDFYARALLSSAAEDVNGIYSTGGWVTNQLAPGYVDNYYYGIRRFPYAVKTTVGANTKPHNPLTFADIDPTQVNLTDGAFPRGPFGSSTAFQVHNIGEVWAMALLEVRARFIARLGFTTGNQRILQFVTDGMKLDPIDPNLLQGRDSILAAANAGGGTAADITDIWAGFATRGMGTLATVNNATTGAVTQNFNIPGDAVQTFSINDVSLTEGNAGTKNFAFTVTLANPSASESRVNFRTADGTATSGTTFTQPGTITIPDAGIAVPYPSTLVVAGLPSSIVRVKARLNSFTHTFPSDVDVLLVGPGGQKVMLMSDAGANLPVNGPTLTFDDGAPPLSGLGMNSGTYSPTDVALGPADVFPGPAPAGPYGTALSVFNGTNPNGTWSLYVLDDEGPDGGSIGGFSLIISTAADDFVPTFGQLIFPAGGSTTQNVNVTVNGDGNTEPNETFFVNLSSPINGFIGDSQGVGTILDDDSAPLPIVVTGAAGSITATTAVLNGTANPNGFATNAFFEYGLTTSYGSTTPVQAMGSGSSALAIGGGAIGGLSCGTLYHFRATASSTNGTTNGADATFTTGACLPPTVTTGMATVAGRSATLNGTANPNGVATTAYFEWGQTIGYGNTTPAQSLGSGLVAVTIGGGGIAGLACNTQYHFRAVATNANGTSMGGDATFATLACAFGDFNADGKGDLILRNKSTGQNIGWLMNGLTVSLAAFMPTIADTNWEIRGRGDFNGDGKADVILRNKSTGQNIGWLMDGLTVSLAAFMPTIADTNWEIRGVGDFDGDGKADVILRNRSTGQNIGWLMNGLTVSLAAFMPTIADTNWEIVGIGDFNGDGKADVILRNRSTGQNIGWLMNGLTVSLAAFMPTIADTNWEIRGVGDFNGDGKADVVLRNKSTGQDIGWLMDGLTVSFAAFMPTIADTNWDIKGAGDFDGDGKADIILRNRSTGQNIGWLMNGLTVSTAALMPTIADTNWEFVGQGQ